MEVRRTYETGAKSSKIWIAVAALFAVAALGVAGAFLARGMGAASAPAYVKSVTTDVQAPDARERNAAFWQLHTESQFPPAQRDPNAHATVPAADQGLQKPIRTGAQDR
ncbi:MAG TPA: hypothetical protein VGG90_04185 [Candidatus Dormibacteraeota bacterium]|jgi:hypothetical protein